MILWFLYLSWNCLPYSWVGFLVTLWYSGKSNYGYKIPFWTPNRTKDSAEVDVEIEMKDSHSNIKMILPWLFLWNLERESDAGPEEPETPEEDESSEEFDSSGREY